MVMAATQIGPNPTTTSRSSSSVGCSEIMTTITTAVNANTIFLTTRNTTVYNSPRSSVSFHDNNHIVSSSSSSSSSSSISIVERVSYELMLLGETVLDSSSGSSRSSSNSSE